MRWRWPVLLARELPSATMPDVPVDPAPSPDAIAPGTLVLLVGPAGSGKSTWSAAHHPPTTIVSSDALRAAVADDPTDQEATADAFRLLHAIVQARLKRGRTTVVDATNLTDGARRPLLALAARFARPVVAVVFDPPLAVCLAQNAERPGRSVPDAVVRLHHAQLPAAVAALHRAGVPIRRP
jgi:predicted kinase